MSKKLDPEHNEQAVWKVYPEATYFGVDDKSKFPHPENCVCQVYDNSGLDDKGNFIDSKVIGEGNTYEEAWADAVRRLPPLRHPHRDNMVDNGFCLTCQRVHSFFVESQ